MTAIERALAIVGKQSDLALRCGVTQQCISKWVSQGYVNKRFINQVSEPFYGRISRKAFIQDLERLTPKRSIHRPPESRAVMNYVDYLNKLQDRSHGSIEKMLDAYDAIPSDIQDENAILITHERDMLELRKEAISALTNAAALLL